MELARQEKQKRLLLEQEHRRKKHIYAVGEGLRSEKTAFTYTWHFDTFLKRIQKTEEELLRLGENPKDPKNKELERVIIDYIQYLDKTKNLRPGTITSGIAAIFHFLDLNDVIVNRRKILQFIPPDESVRYDRAYTHDEIEELLNTADKRLKVVVLLMANGLRQGALPDLLIQDLEKIELPQGNVKKAQEIYRVWVYARSKKSKYYTFVTPETTAAIDDYLEFRNKVGGETVQKASPLIREQFDVEGKSTKTRSNINNPRKLSIPGLSKLIERALLGAGIDPNQEVLSTRRDYFSSLCW